MAGPRVFVLSPARLDGARAQHLLAPKAKTPSAARGAPQPGLAHALRSPEGAPIGAVFAYCSSLYFRGKYAYGSRFGRPPQPDAWMGKGALVITSNRGLIAADARVTLEHLEAFAETDIAADEPRFRRPLARDAARLADELGPDGEVVLLGSVASTKYVEPLLEALGPRLLFPTAFVGRGDMSRGGLLLRAVEAGEELAYAPVQGATLHGARPPRLEPKRR